MHHDTAWRLKDISWESVLFLHLLCPGAPTQVFSLGGGSLDLLRHLKDPEEY